MGDIRTPDDERPDWLYLPFTEGWYYQGATYGSRIEDGVRKPGHSPYAVDFNRRTKTGAWVQDLGDPVLAPQDGTVAEVDKSEGLVMLHHHGGLTQVELRHMQNINVQPGDRVRRGDRVGRIGDVAGSGRSTAPHLHMVQYARKTTKDPFRRVPLTIEGKRLPVSVGDSDARPPGWTPPTPVLLQGPPPKATWESAAKDAIKALEKAEGRIDGLSLQLRAANEELRTVKADLTVATAKVVEQGHLLDAASDRIAELEALTPPDCAEQMRVQRESLLAAVSDGVDALVAGLRVEV